MPVVTLLSLSSKSTLLALLCGTGVNPVNIFLASWHNVRPWKEWVLEGHRKRKGLLLTGYFPSWSCGAPVETGFLAEETLWTWTAFLSVVCWRPMMHVPQWLPGKFSLCLGVGWGALPNLFLSQVFFHCLRASGICLFLRVLFTFLCS